MKTLLLASISLFIVGCSMNPNKEARIQQLETELMQTTELVNELETRVQTLESSNKTLEISAE